MRSWGVEAIRYDVYGYGTIESEDIMNLHIYRMEEIKKLLQTDGVQDFMGV